jgi:hypothetical protein
MRGPGSSDIEEQIDGIDDFSEEEFRPTVPEVGK